MESLIAKECSKFFEVPIVENLDEINYYIKESKIKNNKLLIDGNAVKRITKEVFQHELYTSLSTKFKR